MVSIRINGTTSPLIISGGIQGGTDFLWVDPVKREYVKLDIDGGTPRSRHLADMVYSNDYLYIFRGISVCRGEESTKPVNRFVSPKYLTTRGSDNGMRLFRTKSPNLDIL